MGLKIVEENQETLAEAVETLVSTPMARSGKDIKDCATVQEALIESGLNWEVETKPLFTKEGIEVNASAVYRPDVNEVLGVVGKTYHTLQNRDAFDFFNTFIESGQASFEYAGSVDRGRKVLIQAKINDELLEIVPGDRISKHIMLGTSHDGSMAVRAGFTPIRALCANMLQGVDRFSGAGNRLIRLHHTSGLEEKLKIVASIMDVANQEFNATAEAYKVLASRGVNQKDLINFIKLVFVGDNYATLEQAGKKPGLRIVEKVSELFECGQGANLIKPTYWRAYNAITEYLTHYKGSCDEQRANSCVFGDSALIGRRALTKGLELAA